MNRPSQSCGYGDKRVDLPSNCFKCVYEWVVLYGFFIVCGIFVKVLS